MSTESNKETAKAFYELMFNQAEPREAIKRFVGDRYIQHNPVVPDGKDGFIAYFERMAQEFPGKRVPIQRVIAECDLVVVHCRQDWPGSDDYAAIDIFRCDKRGKIVEHWDVLQVLPKASANTNGMF